MSTDTTIEGLDELTNNFNNIIKKMGKVNVKAFTDDCLDLLGKSVRDAPIDTGDLRGSGSLQIDNSNIANGNKDGSITVTGAVNDMETSSINGLIGFSEVYAVRQHEHEEYKHPKGGQAKYLEQPFRENEQKYIKHIAEAVKGALK